MRISLVQISLLRFFITFQKYLAYAFLGHFFTPFSCPNDLCCVVIAVLRIPNNIGEIDIDLIMEINN